MVLLLRRRSTYVGSAEFVTQNFKFTSDPRQRMIKNGAGWGRRMKEGRMEEEREREERKGRERKGRKKKGRDKK